MRLSKFVVMALLLPMAAMAEPLIDGPSQRGRAFETVEAAFRARVVEAFPAGALAVDMEARLTAEGFTLLEGYAEV